MTVNRSYFTSVLSDSL